MAQLALCAAVCAWAGLALTGRKVRQRMREFAAEKFSMATPKFSVVEIKRFCTAPKFAR